MAALKQYTVPPTPPANPWIDKPKTSLSSPTQPPSSPDPSSTADLSSPPPTPPPTSTSDSTQPASASNSTQKDKDKDKDSRRRNKRRVPVRQLIRHVLRARVEASRALTSFFSQLEAEAISDGKRVFASSHLAKQFGGFASPAPVLPTSELAPTPGVSPSSEHNGAPVVQGFRHAREVIAFLRDRGARIVPLDSRAAAYETQSTGESDYWAGAGAVLSSDGEVEVEVESAGSSSEAGIGSPLR